jgi:dienelactone hydrolase
MGTTGGVGGVGGSGGMTGGVGGTPSGGSGGAAGMTGGSGGMTGGSGGMTGGVGGVTGGSGGMSGGSGGMSGGSGGTDSDAGGTGGGGGDLEPWKRGEDPTAASVMANGPYTVAEITEADGLRNGDAYGDAGGLSGGATVYYPTDADAPFGAVVIVPGWQYQRTEMAGWGPFLASHGIVVMNIDPNSVSADDPALRSLGLIDALVSIKGENTRSGSPLMGKLDEERMGVMGWSMGGGGTWLTADEDPGLKTAISLCGWIIGVPGSTTKAASLQIASLGDPLANGMSQPVYDAIPAGVSKMLIEFEGGDHYIGNDPSFASGQIGKYGLSWIKVYLEGDDRYMQFLESEPTNTTEVRRAL